MRYLLISLAIALTLFAKGQNLVPNYSFEVLENLPVKENPKNTFQYEPTSGFKPFQINLKSWFAGSKTTPDLRITNEKLLAVCRRRHTECDEPRTGDIMVGLITSMQNTYTDSYREYIQVKLAKTLHPGVKTYVEMWVIKERQAKLVSNNIGIHFSQKKIFEETEEVVNRVPQFNHEEMINKDGAQWVKIGGSFVPEIPLIYMTIGNFFDNDHTQVEKYEHYAASPYTPPYAYYLIDDIRVWQEGQEPEPVFDTINIKVDEAIILENIVFKFDRAELEASSKEELEKLYSFLQDNPVINIAIHGHTDNKGNEEYNLKLSEARSQAVVNYLIDRGISSDRMTYQGFGEQKPVVSNETEEGRAQNRRVEFMVIK